MSNFSMGKNKGPDLDDLDKAVNEAFKKCIQNRPPSGLGALLANTLGALPKPQQLGALPKPQQIQQTGPYQWTYQWNGYMGGVGVRGSAFVKPDPKSLVRNRALPDEIKKGDIMGYSYKVGDMVKIESGFVCYDEVKECVQNKIFRIEAIQNNHAVFEDKSPAYSGNYCYLINLEPDPSKDAKLYAFRCNDLIRVLRPRVGQTLRHIKTDKRFLVTEGKEEKNGKISFILESVDSRISKKFYEEELPDHFELCKEGSAKIHKKKGIFDSVILPKDHIEAIRAAIAQTRADVYEKIFDTWGFGDILEKGRGSNLLFYGPPGTGKTLMGQAIAEMLGRDIRIVQTAEVESAEPGGCERAIKAFFAEAKKSNLVLLFDECDSLIYDRSHVGMILAAQINCLLSEMEKFDGVAIFTTNNTPVLDPAFERRLALKLEFPMPDKEARLKIWERFFPKKEILSSDVNLAEFAKFVIPGGTIKNICLGAARRAAFLGKECIELEDLKFSLKKEEEGFKAFRDREERPRLVRGGGYGMSQGVKKDIYKIKESDNGV